ncbi:MAG: hypothetical protein FJY77_04540 [Candidatus Altiarchaeales archaeon]|nr:hypothetical protein [Candidatus Altiarchaeales archaeon]
MTIPREGRVSRPDSIFLDEDQRKAGETIVMEAQLNGLLTNMDLCLWGVRAVVSHCERRGVDAEKLWNWAPDQDSEWGRDIALPSWRTALPEHLQEGKLPTLRWMHDAIEKTLRNYQIERFRTFQLLPKGDLPTPREI